MAWQKARSTSGGQWLALQLLVCLVCLLAPPAGVARQEPAPVLPTAGLTPQEKAWLAAHPVLRMGANRDAPPFTFAENGRHRGMDAEIMRRLATALGVRFEPVIKYPWDQVLAMARSGDVDLLSLLPAAPSRAGFLNYTEPVTDVEYALFGRSDEVATAGIHDLVGRRVAVVGSFAVRNWIERDYPGVNIVPTESAIEALRLLSTGGADGAVSTVGGASYLIRQQGIVNLRVQQVLYRTPLVVGVRKDWPELVTILNKAIAQLDRAEVDQIKAEFVGLRGEGYTRDEVLLAALSLGLLVLGVILVLNARALRRQRALIKAERATAAQLAEANGQLQQQIAAREQAQVALQDRENQFRLLFENSMDGVLHGRPDGTLLAANRAACQMFGMTLQQMQHGGRNAVLDSSDPRLVPMLRDRATQGRTRGELTLVRADGSRFEAEISSAIYTGHDGTMLASTVIRDITERRRAEAQLRLLEACVANLNDVVLITEAEPFDEPGPRIVFVNDAFTRMTGYSRQEALGRSPRFLQGPKSDRAEIQRMGAALRRWEPVRVELVNYTKAGAEVWIEMQIVPIADARGWYTHWVAIERDVSERKRAEARREALEQQLREAQKMEAVGTLAGGIAHDFNNILGSLLVNVSLARNDLAPDHPARASVEQIGQAGLRARSLVEQILTFSRRQPQVQAAQAVAPIVHETATLLRATLPANVKLELHLPEQPLHILADATQVQQVLVNLCTNAWHALRGSTGRIDVALEAMTVQADGPLASLLLPGPHAHLSVSDNGCGMDAATQAHIFEPFFTTKPVGAGTGLGLSVVHGIVGSHRGAITVRSAPGEGATFDLYFPLVEAPAEPAPAESVAAGPTRGEGEHVLYLDDDTVMLAVVQRLLAQLGYRATCLARPEDALAAVRNGSKDFDLVISDYNMPEQTGLDVARALREMAPDLAVVITTGFISEQLQAEAQALGVRALIRKEKTLEEIGLVIRRVLDEQTAPTSARPAPP